MTKEEGINLIGNFILVDAYSTVLVFKGPGEETALKYLKSIDGPKNKVDNKLLPRFESTTQIMKEFKEKREKLEKLEDKDFEELISTYEKYHAQISKNSPQMTNEPKYEIFGYYGFLLYVENETTKKMMNEMKEVIEKIQKKVA